MIADKGIKSIRRILIAAPKSGSGKTLFTCGLLKLLKDEGKDPVAFKCGPDYIDPLFHKRVLGIESYNLDSFFMDEKQLNKSLLRAEGHTAVIEGVMGIYDGLGVDSVQGSCYEIAALTGTPILLIADAHGAGRSIISVIKGILADDDKKLICGVVLNRISAAFYAKLSPVMEEELSKSFPHVKLLGAIPNDPALKIGSRHLGLDISSLDPQVITGIERMSELIKQYIDTDVLFTASASFAAGGVIKHDEVPGEPGQRAGKISIQSKEYHSDACAGHPVLAVAMDEAFCFYYKDNLDMFAQQGVKIKFFSPVHDKAIPEDACGILLGGGYPELYLKELSANTTMLESVRNAIGSGMPSLAECGGFMYLHERIADPDGNLFDMAGVIEGECTYTGRSVRFGYMTIRDTARDAAPLAGALKGIKGHEFHYYDSTSNGELCTAAKPAGAPEWNCICGNEVSLWGFPHFYYPSAPEMAGQFIQYMRAYIEKIHKKILTAEMLR